MSDNPKTIPPETQPSLSTLLISLWCHLTKKRKRQMGLTLLLMLISAFAELMSLGALIPFIVVLTSPDRILNYTLVKQLSKLMGITSSDQLVLPLVVLFVFAAFASGMLRLLMLWVNTRLSFAIGADLSLDAYKRTLYQPYRIFVTRNSSDIITGITGKTMSAMEVLQGLLNVTSSSLLLVILMLGLLAIDPYVVLIVTIIFGLSYGMIAWISQRQLKINGMIIAHEGVQAYKALQEGLGGIRDVLLNGSQQVYCEIYRRADSSQRIAKAGNVVMAVSPRFLMEIIGIMLIAVLAYGLSHKDGGIGSALPVLGALALGAQRMIPALQQIYFNWAIIVGNQASLADAIVLLDQPMPVDAAGPEPEMLDFEDSISFESLRFRYSTDGPWVLNGVNLSILKGSRIGFVGVTGSGKTTALDLLMGLLEPEDGQMLVDGRPIKGERLKAWQKSIAHVPQSIFLADTTITENIAFGIPTNEIDMDRVREAAKKAQIAEFIEGLRKGYNELVGERGIRLSGGQRQRIGIARALYKRASVLVFDEATSSLDNATELAVMESIESLNRDLTILIIAHRLTTVQRCDEIIELEHGRVVAQGSYHQLLERSPSFRSMVLAVA